MTKIRLIVSAVCLIATVALIPQPASAGVVYTTLGPSGEYVVFGTIVDSNQVIADLFTLGAGTTVGDAVLALGHYGANNNPVNVYIESDSSGPGSIIASLSQVGTILPVDNGFGGGLVTFTCSGAACTLGAGSYWLVAREPYANTGQVWDNAYLDATTTVAFNLVGSPTGPWSRPYSATAGGFRLDDTGSGVPEPTSILLFATGLLGIGIARRRSIGRG
jgi:hypothetical protein